MMRAARFAAQLGFTVAPEVVAAMTAMAERISIVSAERVRDELVKLVLGRFPVRGLRLLVETGLAAQVLPELPALALERDEHHRHKDVYEHSLTVLEQSIDLEDRLGGPDFVSRFAALMHDVGKPKTRRFGEDNVVTFHHHDVVGAKLTRKRMQALKFSNDQIDAVASLVELHLRFHGYGSGEWTDAAVRRYVRDAGDQLERLHVLTRADCTTRNKRKAQLLRRTYDDLESRIARLSEEEELASIRPDLDGNQIMEVLGIAPGGRSARPTGTCSSCGSTTARWARNRPRPPCSSGTPAVAEPAVPGGGELVQASCSASLTGRCRGGRLGPPLRPRSEPMPKRTEARTTTGQLPQLTLPLQSHTAEGPHDQTGMYVMHHALRRDFVNFVAAVQNTPVSEHDVWTGLEQRWDRFADALHHHHKAEDDHLWPVLLQHAEQSGSQEDQQLLADMAAEHGRIDPALKACHEAFAAMREHPCEDRREALETRLSEARRPPRAPGPRGGTGTADAPAHPE